MWGENTSLPSKQFSIGEIAKQIISSGGVRKENKAIASQFSNCGFPFWFGYGLRDHNQTTPHSVPNIEGTAMEIAQSSADPPWKWPSERYIAV